MAPSPPAAVASFIEHRFSCASMRHCHQRTPVGDNRFQRYARKLGSYVLHRESVSSVATEARTLALRGAHCDVPTQVRLITDRARRVAEIARGAVAVAPPSSLAGSGQCATPPPPPLISGTYAARPEKRRCRRQSVNHGRRRAMSETVFSASALHCGGTSSPFQ